MIRRRFWSLLYIRDAFVSKALFPVAILFFKLCVHSKNILGVLNIFVTGCSLGCKTNTEWKGWGSHSPSCRTSGSFEGSVNFFSFCCCTTFLVWSLFCTSYSFYFLCSEPKRWRCSSRGTTARSWSWSKGSSNNDRENYLMANKLLYAVHIHKNIERKIYIWHP